MSRGTIILSRKGAIVDLSKAAKELLRVASPSRTRTLAGIFGPRTAREIQKAIPLANGTSSKPVLLKNVAVNGLSLKLRLHQKSGRSSRIELSLEGRRRAGRIGAVKTRSGGSSKRVRKVSRREFDEEYFRNVVQSLPLGVAIVQKDQIVFANSPFARILRYHSVREVIGQPLGKFMGARERRFLKVLARRLESGESATRRFETQVRRADGAIMDIETTLSVGLYTGKPAIHLTMSDITQRKELEKRLTDSEKLFRNVVNSMADALVVSDMEGRVLDVNEEFEQLTGWTRGEAMKVGFPYPWVDEEDLRSSLGWLDSIRSRRRLRDVDMVWTNKAGGRIAVSVNSTWLKNVAGVPMVMVTLARDISERKAAQAELGKQLRKLEGLYRLSRSLSGTLDLAEIARSAYQELARISTYQQFELALYDEDENAIHSVLQISAEDGERREAVPKDGHPLPQLVEYMKRAVDSRRSVHAAVSQRGKAGAGPDPFVMVVPLISNSQSIGLMAAVSANESAFDKEQRAILESIASLCAIAVEKAKLHQETVIASEEIAARNKELDDFSYVVSHDLKEPLISVEGYTSILRQSLPDENSPQREYIDSILESCSHMKKLIDDLLVLSRVSKLSEQMRPVALEDVVGQIRNEMQFAIQSRGAKLVVRTPLPEIRGVLPYLKIVFRNLIGNALKFCDKPVPEIEVWAELKGPMAMVSVQDNGIGIPKEYYDRIFMIFQRLHSRELFEGTGAGLTIVKKIVEAHGGKIWVESEPGIFARFTFTVPLS